jgi:tetratricopeptide (TPR) repeat protein
MKKTMFALVGLGCLLPGLAHAASGVTAPASTGTTQVGTPRRALDISIEAYRAAVAANPKDAIAHNKLGVCYQQADKLKLARKEYQKAVDLNPGYAEAWNNLGTLEHADRRYKKAVARYQKAVELKPEQATFRRNLGAAYVALGDLSRAVAAYSEAVRLDPTSLEPPHSAAFQVGGVDPARLCFTYAKLFAGLGDLESALVWLTKAKDLGFKDFSRVSSDPDFVTLVKDPRYSTLARY